MTTLIVGQLARKMVTKERGIQMNWESFLEVIELQAMMDISDWLMMYWQVSTLVVSLRGTTAIS